MSVHHGGRGPGHTSRKSATAPAEGPELVTNGTFDTNTTGWTNTGTSLTQVAGRMEVSAAFNGGSQNITTVIGGTYRIIADLFAGTTNPALRVGSSGIGSTEYINRSTSTAGTSFVATTTTTTISCFTGGSGTAQFDNISLKRTA